LYLGYQKSQQVGDAADLMLEQAALARWIIPVSAPEPGEQSL